MDHSGTTIHSPASVWKTRVSFAAMTTCRILLGIGMVPYAVNKILDYQFQVSAWSYGQQLGNVPGRALLWATMGYSPALQVFLGVLELVPAILLLFARTRRIGALAMFPVVLNVALLNFALDLWHDTKIISSGMLALNVFLLLYDWRIYVSFFTRLLAPDAPIANRKLRIAGKVAGFVLPVVAIAWFLVDDARLTREENNTATDFIGERQINGAGTWKIDSFDVDGNPVLVKPRDRFFFDFQHKCYFGREGAFTAGTFEGDRKNHAFIIKGLQFSGSNGVWSGSYSVEGRKVILHGTRDGQPVNLSMSQDNWGPMLPFLRP